MDITPVILAGGHGERLLPLTKDVPKALLPVANRPLISLPLGHLEKCGFRSAVVVTVESIAAQMKAFLAEKHSGTIHVDLVIVPDDAGTAQALLAAKAKVHGDVLVMSVDLVTDVPLQKLADTHHLRDAAITVLLKERPAPREGKPPKWETAFVLDPAKEQLLYMAARTDCDATLGLRKSLLHAHGNVTVTTALTDVHCYVLARWVFDLLEARPELSNIRYDLVPYLLRHQYIHAERALPEALDMNLSVSGHDQPARHFRTTDHSRIQCAVVIESATGAVCVRANTLTSYLEVNLEIARGALGGKVGGEVAEVGGKTGFGNDCVRGKGVAIGLSTTVKRSVVGSHCRLGSGVKLANCVVMDHVTFGDKVSLSNCVICSNAEVREGATLTNCQVGASFTVDKDAQHKNAVLCNDEVIE
ncbi:nucleotide-diphospho-sugar transferase [Pavlovales sp. CCMP2436]|nr:nucleotide-diphospho-sugar transferase [Pavlovales sp. CCMP2436]